ncbi:MAG: SEC-C metal-binding domain-containing protein, partial [Pseudomonadota bacterium]
LEAKERVEIQMENQTLASITFQNYFRMYPKLAGMTGTAMTEAGEFAEIYKLDVIEIPTNVPVSRRDEDDEVYRSAREKWEAISTVIEDCQKRNQPVLVGTVSIEKSESLSALLKQKKIKHAVLNARYHEQEAQIISQAGRPAAVTIATNMAGRGTDIQLGGNLDMRIANEADAISDAKKREAKVKQIEEEVSADRIVVREAGGLCVIGTERHESRRIDNQLRGRSGRQGDPGLSKFFLSLEDDLMRIFGSDRMDGMLRRLGLEEGEAIIHPWINKALEKAQGKVEARNFEIRKQLLKYDDVMNDQRKVIYEQRKDLMRTSDVSGTVEDMREEVLEDLVTRCIPSNAYAEQWEMDSLHEETRRLFGLDLPVVDWAKEEGIAEEEIRTRMDRAIREKYAQKVANYGPDVMRMAEKSLLLQILDQLWKEHLLALDHLRQGVNLRAYAQRDPLLEYKREAFELFEGLLVRLRETVTQVLMTIEVRVNRPEQVEEQVYGNRAQQGVIEEQHPDPAQAYDDQQASGQQGSGRAQAARAGATGTITAPEFDPDDPSTWTKTPRNAPCPCGSGKKYKHCHGKMA